MARRDHSKKQKTAKVGHTFRKPPSIVTRQALRPELESSEQEKRGVLKIL
jgi:hypothetical protein